VGWIGLFAPANTPAPVVQKIAFDVQHILSQADAVQRLQQLGAEAKWMGPAEYTPFVATEVKRLTGILADIGVKPQ
jgi:tripartite-type tricarboxylate transporter receptor subunit TctC